MQTDGSSSLAPDRTTSLHSQNRPVTSGNSYYHISSTIPSPMYTRSNRSSYHPPSTYCNHEWDVLRQKETAQLMAPDDGRTYAIPFSQFGPTTGRLHRTHARRGSISESIKNGISSVRSLGRRMSLSMKAKRSNTTDDGLLVPDMLSPTHKEHIQLCERAETISSTSNRPRSIIEGLRARRRPSMPIIKYSPCLDDTQSQAVSRTDSCRTESFHRAATMPQRPGYPTGGAGARASAAAQNEALQLARATPLPPYRPRSGSFEEFTEYRDSESGIGIMVYSDERSESTTNSVSRYDPADVLATELCEHVMSFLDAPTLRDLELVSRRWRDLCQSQTVWRQVFYREYAPSVSSRMLGAPKIAGLGKNIYGQDYRRLYSIRKLIDKRWENGEAAAIYLNGHKDSVYCVQFDEDKIITGSRDNTIRIWDARSYRCIGKLGPPNNPRERNHIIRGDCEPTGVVPFFKMDVQSVEPAIRSKPPSLWHQASVLCLQYDDDLLVTGSSDFTAIVWSIKHGYKPIFRLTGHKAGILDVALDSKRIITCSKDTTIKIWNRKTGALLSTLKGHRGPVNAVQVRNNLLASASGDGMAKLWRLDTGMCIKEFHSRERGLACVEFSEDGRTIFAGGNDHVVYEYDTTTANVKRELRGHSELVRSLHLDSANGRIVSGSYDHSIKVWNSKTGSSDEDGGLMLNLGGLTSSWMLAAKSNYRKIACASQDGRVVMIDFGFGINGVELVEA